MSEHLETIADEYYRRVQEIPLGNSDFQNAAFVEAAQQTPERAYRAILLNLGKHLDALQTAYYQLRREDLEIRKLKQTIEAQDSDEFEQELACIDLEETQLKRRKTQKLVADAQHQVQWFWQRLQSYPALTRKAFEEAEYTHFKLRLERQIQVAQLGPAAGSNEALKNMSYDLPHLQETIQQLALQSDSQGGCLNEF